MNHGFTYGETVGSDDEGAGLAAFLASRHVHSSKDEWQERIGAGRVLVDGRPAHPETLLLRGMRVTWRRPPWEEPDVPMSYDILLEDRELLAVAKPSGLPTLPGAGFLENTLLYLVRSSFPGASPAHRLGRGTSGVVLFGRGGASAANLAASFRERKVKKTYLAMVQGRPERDFCEIDVPIGTRPHPALGIVHAAASDGKVAFSRLRVLERRDETSLVEVEILTGRPHQIRIHCAAIGHPLAGDPLYAEGGVFKGDNPVVPGECGYLLHAWKISLPHPASGTTISVESPVPPALRPAANPDFPFASFQPLG